MIFFEVSFNNAVNNIMLVHEDEILVEQLI